MPRGVWHEVTDLHTEPGDALTRMAATVPGIRGCRGYLNPDTGHADPAPPQSSKSRPATVSTSSTRPPAGAAFTSAMPCPACA